MKTKRLIIAILLALMVVTITPLSIMAASDDSSTANSQGKNLKGTLAIVAPYVVSPGEEIQLTVFVRKDQSTVGGAAVWAVSRDNIEDLTDDLKSLRQSSGASLTDEDYEDTLGVYAILLGHTHGDGTLSYTFDEPENYLLVAIKANYLPGKERLLVRGALSVTAEPRISVIGEDVTITVTDKNNSDPVEGAETWAAKFSSIEIAKEKIAELREKYAGNWNDIDWETVLDTRCIPLGETDENGEIICSFDETGKYLILSIKQGYIPGFSGFGIIAEEPDTSVSDE